MDGYLLDTNTFDYLADQADAWHQCVRERFEGLPSGTPVFVSAVTAGEVVYGIRTFPAMAEAKRRSLLESLAEFRVLDVTTATKDSYAAIRAALFSRAIKEGRRGLRPEQLRDPVTSLQIGIQENDVWLVAQALEHNLVFVTNDMKMRPLWVAAGEALRVANWARPDFRWPEAGSV
jgi:predicted nucleic acid-binding protein